MRDREERDAEARCVLHHHALHVWRDEGGRLVKNGVLRDARESVNTVGEREKEGGTGDGTLGLW